MEKCEKTHILNIFGSCVLVHLECVPVHPSIIQSVSVHFRGVSVHLMLCSQFRPVLVFWPYISHFLSDLSDSNGQLK